MRTEAVLLTGGASRRMGLDKASLLVAGEPLAERLARLLQSANVPVTVLGNEPLRGCAFLPDETLHQGPLSALAQLQPSAENVLLLSCDLPLFDPAVLPLMEEELGQRDAVVLQWESRPQPLCGLYRASAFKTLRTLWQQGELRLMRWLECLNVATLDEDALNAKGFRRDLARNVNSQEEFAEAVAELSSARDALQ